MNDQNISCHKVTTNYAEIPYFSSFANRFLLQNNALHPNDGNVSLPDKLRFKTGYLTLDFIKKQPKNQNIDTTCVYSNDSQGEPIKITVSPDLDEFWSILSFFTLGLSLDKDMVEDFLEWAMVISRYSGTTRQVTNLVQLIKLELGVAHGVDDKEYLEVMVESCSSHESDSITIHLDYKNQILIYTRRHTGECDTKFLMGFFVNQQGKALYKGISQLSDLRLTFD